MIIKLNILKNICVLCVCMLGFGVAKAQTAAEAFKAAEAFYAKADYYNAALYYEQALNGGGKGKKPMGFAPYTVTAVSNKPQSAPKGFTRLYVVNQAAESYRKINYWSKALPYYQKLKDTAAATYPAAKFWYAKSLKAETKFDEADQEFRSFIAETTDENLKAKAQQELANLAFINKQLTKKELKYYNVNKLGTGINVEGSNYAPTLTADGKMIFSSTRSDSSNKNPHLNQLYSYDIASNSIVTKLNIDQPKDMHQCATAITADGNTLYFTKWMINKDGKKMASIYKSTKNGDKWSNPVIAEGDINTSGSNSQQPAISADGQYILYSSDKAGGKGGLDIWMMPVAGGGSVNLANINTAEDEQSPYYHNDTKTLIFSTNGRIGMGGFDFFEAKGDLASLNEPVNLGYPVNSVKDDIYFVSSTGANMLDNIYLSSDRSSPCCLEMFSIQKRRVKKMITGKVVDCATGLAISNVKIVSVDKNNKVVDEQTTASDGGYKYFMDDYAEVKIAAAAPNYYSKEFSFSNTKDELDSTYNPDLCLTKIPPPPPEVNKPVVLENVLYDFNKATLKAESLPMLDTLVHLMQRYPDMAVELGAHTDNVGTDKYNKDLSERRAQSVVKYLVTQGIDASRLTAVGYGETKPVSPNKIKGKDNPEGRAKNRRTEFKVLHY